MTHKLSRILVAGGAGFIGSHLVDKLVSDGTDVTVLDNLCSGKTENLAVHLQRRSIKFVKGDICNFRLVRSLMGDVDAVVNLAAVVSVAKSVEDPLLVHKVNATGALTLLKGCLDGGVKTFVQASSAAVYGEAEKLPVSEDAVLDPLSPYAVAKITAEDYARVFSRIYGLEAVSLRFFNVYGPRQAYNPYSGVITVFIKHLLINRAPTVFGDGEQTRDFVSVHDVASCCLLALTKGGISGEIFNVASGTATSVNKLVELLQKITGKLDLKPNYGKPRSGEIRHSRGSIDKAMVILGYYPKTTLEYGLREIHDIEQAHSIE